MRIKHAIRHIANELGETKPRPCTQIRRILTFLGKDATFALLAETKRIESEGGMMLPNGSRRRTPGGVFFHIAAPHLTPAQRDIVYPYRTWNREKQAARRAAAANTPPPAPPARWTERGTWREAVRQATQEAHTVKITLMGPLGKTVEKERFTLATMTHVPRLDKLPKGIPRPDAQQTTYIVYIGGKQWQKVKAALANPEDVAIIEGTPMWDEEYQAMTVFATSITTKLMQQAKRKPKQGAVQAEDEGDGDAPSEA